MNKGIQALRERRAAKAQEARKILDENTVENGKWNKEYGDKVDALYAEIEDIDGQIGRHQRLLDIEAGKHFEKIELRDKDLDPSSPRAIYRKWLRGGKEGLSAEEAATIRNTMSTTTGSQGGYTVATEVATQVSEALKAFGGMRQVAEIIRTQQGNDIQFPTSDGTSEVGELVGQNTAVTAADPAFGSVVLSAYKFSSKKVAVPFELLQDSSIDIEAFIQQRLLTRIARITNTYFTTGSGSSQPNGIVTAAGSGKVGTTGQTTTVIYDDLIDLIHSVDPAYRALGRARFMLNDSSLKVIRKIKDSAGRPIWTPAYEAGIVPGAPDMLLGYPITINQDIAVMAANAKSILFGDFTFYKIRDVLDFTLFRMTDSAFTSNGQVGFLAFQRSGGQFVDVGGAVKYYQNSAT